MTSRLAKKLLFCRMRVFAPLLLKHAIIPCRCAHHYKLISSRKGTKLGRTAG
jgi:hypothetical protein